MVLLLLIFFSIFYSGQFGASYMALPPLLILNFLFIYAVGLLFACIVPFFPDSKKIIDNLFQLLFFASGIFFDFRQVGEIGELMLRWNPFAAFLACYRSILLEGLLPSPELLTAPLIATICLLIASIFAYRHLRLDLPKALLR